MWINSGFDGAGEAHGVYKVYGADEHIPVLLDEAIEGLNVRPGGTYVDATLGGGGYTEKLISILDGGMIVAIDQDPEAIASARERFEGVANLQIVHENFRELGRILDSLGIESIDGVVFDLGISSIQLSNAEKGISFQQNGPLDMRFDPGSDASTAADILAEWPEGDLRELFFLYGERFAGRIARRIVRERDSAPIDTVAKLSKLVAGCAKGGKGKKNPATRVFLALRCEVNRELESISTVLPEAIRRSNPGGRVAVVTYHSLEDRIVKDRFKRAARGCECELPVEMCGCPPRPCVKLVNKKGIGPSATELESNRRARSGKLRIAEKI